MGTKVTHNGGLENLLPAIFPWRITGSESEAKLAISLLAKTPKPSFALTVSDDLVEWSLWCSEESYRVLERATRRSLVDNNIGKLL